jgi:hypothetical protein
VTVDDNANIVHLYSSTYNLFGVTDEGDYIVQGRRKGRKHQQVFKLPKEFLGI